MTDTEFALLELLKASLFRTEPCFPAQVDWEAVFEEAKAQAVVALAAPAVPSQEAGKWRLYAQHVQAEYMRLLYEQSRLIQLFDTQSIPLVILKGTAAAVYYPVPCRRSTGDVDFLVPPERFEDAKRLMEENGYQFILDEERHIEYTKGGVVLELHRRFSNDDYDIESILADGMVRAVTREIDHISFPSLPDDENGLVLLAHIRHHLKSSGLGLRQVIDWMMFVHAQLDEGAWAGRFQALARKAGMETLAITVTCLCKTWLGLPDDITWCDGADPWTMDMLLLHLLDHGNLGVKITDRDHPLEIAILIRKNGLFGQLHLSAVGNWPAAQKHPVLWPVAWFRQIGRWIRTAARILIKRTRIKEEINRVNEKDQFYSRLGI